MSVLPQISSCHLSSDIARVNERVAELRAICAQTNWASLLAERWKISDRTIYRFAWLGHLGQVHRRTLSRIFVSSESVRRFEERYAVALGLVPALTITETAARYAISITHVYRWRRHCQFPNCDHIPRSQITRVRLGALIAWESQMGVTPTVRHVSEGGPP